VLLLLIILAAASVRPAVRAASPAPPRPATLIYGSTQEPDTLDPLLTQTAAGQAVESAVFDSLLRLDARDVLQPDLAVSWTQSKDGRTWTFHLRRGVRWADGQNLTSTDVYWTYLSIINPNNHVATTQGWDQVDRMTTPDRFTLVVHLRHWLAPWLQVVGTTAILPKHALYRQSTINRVPFNRTPFGTGPYLVKEWQPGSHITLVANPYSWQGRPSFSTLVYRIFPDDAHLLAALRDGTVMMGQVNPQQAPIAARFPRTRLVETPGMTWYHVDLKQWGFLREQAVRQALDFATPKEQIVREILLGHGQVATADIAPSLPGYYDPDVPVHRYSPLRAAEILAADGFQPRPDGVLQRCSQAGRKAPTICTPLSLTLWNIAGDYFGAQVNARLAREWGAIGIQVALQTALAGDIFGPNGPQFFREPTGITYGWTNTPDPDDRFYWNSAYIPASPTAAGGNDVAYFFRFSFQQQIDDLTDAGVLQTDPAKRRLIYDQIQRLLADEVPVIFLYWEDTITLVPATLQGFAPNPFSPLFWNVAQWR
jgi:peptide/nickel transport system substrate-binding protein